MEILSNTTHLECLQYNPCVYSHLRSPGLGLCYLLDFRKADLRCGGVAISWAFTFLPPWKPDSLLCLLCIHFPLPSHLPTDSTMGIFVFLSWRSEPGSASLPGIRSSPWCCRGWVLALREPGLCVLVCLSPSPDRWGPRPPRRRGLVPEPPGRAGHKLSARRRPYLFR